MSNGNDQPDEDAALRARLDALSGELKARRPEPALAPSPPAPGQPDALGSGMSLRRFLRV